MFDTKALLPPIKTEDDSSSSDESGSDDEQQIGTFSFYIYVYLIYLFILLSSIVVVWRPNKIGGSRFIAIAENRQVLVL